MNYGAQFKLAASYPYQCTPPHCPAASTIVRMVDQNFPYAGARTLRIVCAAKGLNMAPVADLLKACITLHDCSTNTTIVAINRTHNSIRGASPHKSPCNFRDALEIDRDGGETEKKQGLPTTAMLTVLSQRIIYWFHQPSCCSSSSALAPRVLAPQAGKVATAHRSTPSPSLCLLWVGNYLISITSK